VGGGAVCQRGRGHLRDAQGAQASMPMRAEWMEFLEPKTFCEIAFESAQTRIHEIEGESNRMLRAICLGFLWRRFALAAAAQDTQYPARGQQIPAPDCMNLHFAWENVLQPAARRTHERWLKDIQHWRTERRIRIAYDPSRYELPALKWTQSSFIQPQMMVQDRYFYDPVAGRYTVDRYLDDLEKALRRHRCGAGLVHLSEHGHRRPQPAGNGRVHARRRRGVRQMVADFHRRGVRVLFPMMMWDEGTHQPGSRGRPDAIAALMKQIDADGINGDTQDGVPLGFSLAAEKIGIPWPSSPKAAPATRPEPGT
jgi:gamma-glutamyl hercynylcysteine S-oxide synthase